MITVMLHIYCLIQMQTLSVKMWLVNYIVSNVYNSLVLLYKHYLYQK